MNARASASGFVILLAVVDLAAAQQPTRPTLKFPPLSETPFLEFIHSATARLRLPELRTSRQGSAREIRLWDGFGIGGVQLLIIREVGSGWQAFSVAQVPDSIGETIATLPDTTDWGARWTGAVEAGLLTLPPYPARDSVGFLVMDGFSAVVEWFDGNRYGVSGADNPDSYCSADDRRLMAVLDAIVGHQWIKGCMARP